MGPPRAPTPPIEASQPRDRAAAGQREGTFWRAFWKAATTPSLGALGVAAVTCSVLCLVSPLLLTDRRLTPDAAQYLARNPFDSNEGVSAAAIALASSDPHQDGIVIIGASATQFSLPNADYLALLLRDRKGSPVSVTELTFGGLTVWEMAALADMVPVDYQGAVVLGVGIMTFTTPTTTLGALSRKPRLGFRSMAFEDELRRAGIEALPRSNIDLVNSYRYLVRRVPTLLARLVSGPLEPQRHPWIDGTPNTPANRRTTASTMLHTLTTNGTAAPGVEAVLDRTLARLRQRGVHKVVLLEHSMAPDFVAALGAPRYGAHQERCHRLVAAHGYAYWNLAEEVRLEDPDFYDYCHLRSSAAQRRYATALAARLSLLLPVTHEARGK